MQNCNKMSWFCKSLRLSRSGLLSSTVNNTAPKRRHGLNRRTLKGKSDTRSFSARRPPIQLQFFHAKCLRRDVKILFSGGWCSYVVKRMLNFYVKAIVWSKSQFRATTRWRLLIPSIQKVFFLFQIDCRGGGAAQSRPTWTILQSFTAEGAKTSQKRLPIQRQKEKLI